MQYNEFIDQFMPSGQMRAYLKTVELWPFQITELIYYSPCPLTEKLEGLRKLYEQAEKMEVCDERNDLLERTANCISNIEDALKCLGVEGVFSIEAGHFDEDSLDTSADFETLCTTVEDVMDYVNELEQNYVESYDDDSDEVAESLRWYDVTKWVKDESGKQKSICNYVIINNEICYSELARDYYDDYMKQISYYSGVDLNLPVPFQVGDIIEVNGYPYGPRIRFLLTTVGDNWDCCCLKGMFRKMDGTWESGIVKHGKISYRDYPGISPLYSAHVYEGTLPEGEQLLYQIRDYLAGDESEAVAFEMYRLPCGRPVTDEDIRRGMEAPPKIRLYFRKGESYGD
ncbi:MAG: hypothetical protein IJ794_10095 [Lachnospiraceae bacterium]|nr:hypothetical protein [Lachnospiraceae bacterium]